jgi:hypothetical protein
MTLPKMMPMPTPAPTAPRPPPTPRAMARPAGLAVVRRGEDEAQDHAQGGHWVISF